MADASPNKRLTTEFGSLYFPREFAIVHGVRNDGCPNHDGQTPTLLSLYGRPMPTPRTHIFLQISPGIEWTQSMHASADATIPMSYLEMQRPLLTFR